MQGHQSLYTAHVHATFKETSTNNHSLYNSNDREIKQLHTSLDLLFGARLRRDQSYSIFGVFGSNSGWNLGR